MVGKISVDDCSILSGSHDLPWCLDYQHPKALDLQCISPALNGLHQGNANPWTWGCWTGTEILTKTFICQLEFPIFINLPPKEKG
jgi:hypothetical protein